VGKIAVYAAGKNAVWIEDMSKFYFYTDLESAFNCRRVFALLDGKLPLTNPSRFNDPFDSRLRFVPDFTEEDAKKYLDWDSKQTRLKREIREIQNPMYLAIEQKGQEIFPRWTAFSVSEVNDSLLMWAHYAAQHKGICLELEYDDAKKPANALYRKIKYTTHYPQNIRISLEQGLDSVSLETLLLTKSIDWHYEREWRFAVKDAPADTGIYGEPKFHGLIDSPFEVTGIRYGVRCVDGDHSDFRKQSDPAMWKYTKMAIISKIADRADIAVHQNTLSNTEFKLTLKSLE
jgi:hypothetical protein